ncbi:hypothetical protein HID58_095348 [Brassica napus]|uniref:Uncharacterized protein n=1 Tax=Brassica napus TaxID=3708 RepID=A0ABQ7X3Z4_BRANA|nr:hypothetical protein HID58_095348 [Brassica napus]
MATSLIVSSLVLLGVVAFFMRKRKTSNAQRRKNLKALTPLKHYRYREVKRFTNSFACVVGKGGFATNRIYGDDLTKEEEEITKKMVLVALLIHQIDPSMNRVVEMMEGSLDALDVPPRPIFQIPIAPLRESSTLLGDISVYIEE